MPNTVWQVSCPSFLGGLWFRLPLVTILKYREQTNTSYTSKDEIFLHLWPPKEMFSHPSVPPSLHSDLPLKFLPNLSPSGKNFRSRATWS